MQGKDPSLRRAGRGHDRGAVRPDPAWGGRVDPLAALLEVVGSTAYVTEPATRQVHVVDLASHRVVDSIEVPQVPVELRGVSG